MKMTQTPLTRLLIAAAVVVSLAVGFLVGRLSPSPAPAPAAAASDGNKTETKVLYWYDPMNPGQRFDRPGKSPFMDMDLVPRYANEAEEEDGVRISSRQQQNLGVRTAPVTRRSLSAPLTAYGTVAADARDIIAIPARGDGLIEKLYVSAPQQFVTEGSPLAQLWIPGWTAAQQEYLAVRRLGDPALTAAARQRLRLKLIPEAVIRDVDRSGEPQTRITLRAPHDGYATPQAIRAGSSVSATQTLFDLTKLDRVWIIVDYPEREAGALAVGSRVGAAAAGWPGREFTGTVSALLPDVAASTRTLKARVEVDNPERLLKPGMYLTVNIEPPAAPPPVLAIPQEALIATGSRSRVIVSEGGGYFRPVEVAAGVSGDGWVEIRQGLSEGQQVVTSGQFLIDSEASLKQVLPQMTDPAQPQAAAWRAEGVVEALTDDGVTLSHGPVPELKWGAMTMDFRVPAALRVALHPGQKVRFTFTLDDDGARLVAVEPMDSSELAPAGHEERP